MRDQALVIERVPIVSLSYDPANARQHPEKNLNAIKGSLAKFGQRKPIVTRNGVVIAGNGTLAAATALGWTEIDIIRADDMTATEATAFAIADNRTSEIAEWDLDTLKSTLTALDLDGFDLGEIGFDADDLKIFGQDSQADIGDSSIYTDKIKIPIYEPKGEKPSISELVDREKTKELIATIDSAENVEQSTKEFLRTAAYRHLVFNYQKIAEFYSHANRETKELFEQSALVIIDFKKAIECGFVKMTKDLCDAYEESDYGMS